ncbi:MAG: hypothetical protein E7I45_08125 [Eikenella corrodens]|nr:hypothetical protein [Eikenella corrodens]MDU4300921.1 hypothetical protein [Eikenella corrodens]
MATGRIPVSSLIIQQIKLSGSLMERLPESLRCNQVETKRLLAAS